MSRPMAYLGKVIAVRMFVEMDVSYRRMAHHDQKREVCCRCAAKGYIARHSPVDQQSKQQGTAEEMSSALIESEFEPRYRYTEPE